MVFLNLEVKALVAEKEGRDIFTVGIQQSTTG